MAEDAPAPIGHNGGGRMTLEEFRQGMASLMSLDFEEFVEAGVFAEWQAMDIQTFRRDPFRRFFYADEETTDVIWKIIQSRQHMRKKPREMAA